MVERRTGPPSFFFRAANYFADTTLSDDKSFGYHRFSKRFLYGLLTFQHAFRVFAGKEQAFLPFLVLKDPPPVLINFEMRPDEVEALSKFLDLPRGFVIEPIAIIRGETPRYYLSILVFAVSGLGGSLKGHRAEWTIYASRDGGRRHFLVLEARASTFSLDSVNFFTSAAKVVHEKRREGIYIFAAFEKDAAFEAIISQEGIDSAAEVPCSNEFVTANDFIYWRDGVADRLYYDAKLSDTPLMSIDPSHVRVTDTTTWSQFLEAEPATVVLLQEGWDLVISPWYNLDQQI